MGLYRDKIHLFTSGRFSVLCTNRIGSTIGKGDVIKLTMQTYCTFIRNHEDSFQLVARSVEDMTNDELCKFLGARQGYITTEEREVLLDRAERKIRACLDQNLIPSNLLDWGIYPGPLSDFEEDEVANINKIKQKV